MNLSKCYLRERCKKYETDKECDNSDYCLKLFKVDMLLENSLLSNEQRIRKDLHYDKDGTDHEAFDFLHGVEVNIKDFVDNGKNLFIHSSTCGNGKTSWAVRMIQVYINSIWAEAKASSCRALFISVPTLLRAIKASMTNQDEYADYVMSKVKSADLVIWDDVAFNPFTQYEKGIMFELIDSRYNSNKANIFTSNLKEEQLLEAVGGRIFSRIDGCDYEVELHGADKRKIEKVKIG